MCFFTKSIDYATVLRFVRQLLWAGTGLVVNVSSSLTSWDLLSTHLITSSSAFSTATSLLGPWPYLPCIGQRPRRHGRCGHQHHVQLRWRHLPQVWQALHINPVLDYWHIHLYIFTPLHWGFTVVTSSLSILASFGVPLCHKYFLHQRSIRHLVPIQYCALHQKRKWRGVEGKAEGMKPLKILHEFTHILTKKRSQYGRGVSISLLMILCTHYISYTTDTNISYIALQTKLGLGHR